jgi:hypothetical protein
MANGRGRRPNIRPGTQRPQQPLQINAKFDRTLALTYMRHQIALKNSITAEPFSTMHA